MSDSTTRPAAWTDPEALTEYTQAEYDSFAELINSPDMPANPEDPV